MNKHTITRRTSAEQFARLTNPLSLTPLQEYRNEQSRQWIMRHEAAKRAIAVRKAISDFMSGGANAE